MDKQSIIGFVLIGAILVVWLSLNAPDPKPTPANQPDTTLTGNLDSATNPVNNSNENRTDDNRFSDTKSDIQTVNVENVKNEIVYTIETDLAIYELTSKGARIKKYFLKKYNTWYYNNLSEDAPYYEKNVQLINYSQNGGELDVIFATNDGKLVETSKLDFKLENYGYKFEVKGDDALSLRFIYDFGENRQMAKTFNIKGNDYSSQVDIEFSNMENTIRSRRYDIDWTSGINFVERNSIDEATFATASVFAGDEQIVIDASSEGEIEKKELGGLIDWVGIKSKYFVILISPEVPNADGSVYVEGRKVKKQGLGEREYYSTSLRIPFNNQNYQKDTYNLYMGPVDYNVLKSYEKNYESIFDFGSFFGLKIITRPISEYILLPLFKFLHSLIPNYGFVIIVFSLIIKLVLYPLTKQSYKSMKKTQLLQPKIAELKAKYKDDPQRVQKEQMKLYSTYGINPMGGCLPMVLQMPILFALFTFFKVAIEIRHEPFILWITDLSSPDVIYNLGFTIPLFGVSEITVLAPVLGITMFFQQKMTIKDPSQKAMVYMMPFMFTFLFMGFPSGLNLYYLMFNLLSIIQQYYINHSKGGDSELVPVKNPKKKKPGFMSKMMEAAEKQQKAQQNTKKRK